MERIVITGQGDKIHDVFGCNGVGDRGFIPDLDLVEFISRLHGFFDKNAA
jgi:hypothetical protein